MKIVVEILRFNPEMDREAHTMRYDVEAEPADRLLAVLMDIKANQDPSLGIRRSCAHGVCGSDAMVVNGRERLACKTLIREVAEEDGATIRIEPLRNLRVQRDLMVDQSRFFSNCIQVKPYFISKEKSGNGEFHQSQTERKQYEEGTKCILCVSCYSACPVIRDVNPDFLGPAAVIQAARFNDDSRDQGFAERVAQLDHPNGIWPCESRYECTRVCPRGIKITKIINSTKRKITEYRENQKPE
ncbi:MAG: succinate dehydrogenase iron-sulfur subunit [Candidatus Aminicenantes bacterium]|nr:succinate dehydrogenase iron-sulfur subunit [Candidatus Aminicenantes bacterium]